MAQGIAYDDQLPQQARDSHVHACELLAQVVALEVQGLQEISSLMFSIHGVMT